jgi:hypothetical protein
MSLLKPHVWAVINRMIGEASDHGMRAAFEPLTYAAGRWPLIRLEDTTLPPEASILLVTAGIHGEEIAGPMTFHHRFREIVGAARAAGLRLVAYPLMNPSGFERGKRYNADVPVDAADYLGNNDYLRYHLKGGGWIWDLRDEREMTEWAWSSEDCLAIDLPVETRAMHGFLAREDWPHVAAAVDLHQDYLSPIEGPGAYHYGYGDLGRFRGIVERVGAIVPVLASRAFGIQPGHPEGAAATDADGFIVRHDGSLSDLWHRLGVPHAVTVETTGATPIEKAIEVNLEWIRSLCRLAAP